MIHLLAERVRKAGLLLVLMPLLPSHLCAQTFELDPRKWFPLEVGNAWHYTDDEQIRTEWIVVSDRDTVSNGQRWVRFVTVDCRRGTSSCSAGHIVWYHMTSDYFVLASSDDDFDTVSHEWDTVPRSIFTVNIASDSTLRLRDSPEVDIHVSIEESDSIGVREDSTHLMLTVMGDDLIWSAYTYNIGRVRQGGFGTVLLEGAIVGGKSVGDTSWIQEVVRTDADREVDFARDSFRIKLYPNPFRSQAVVVIEASNPGEYTLNIYDSLGRRMYQETTSLATNQRWALNWSPSHLGKGVYYVRVTNSHLSIVKPIVHE